MGSLCQNNTEVKNHEVIIIDQSLIKKIKENFKEPNIKTNSLKTFLNTSRERKYLNKRIEEKKQNLNKLKEEIEKNKKELEELKQKILEEKKELEKLEKEKEELKQKVLEDKKELEKLEKEKEELEQKILEEKQKLENLEKEKEEFENKIKNEKEEIENEINKFNKDTEEFNKEKEEFNKKIEEQKKQEKTKISNANLNKIKEKNNKSKELNNFTNKESISSGKRKINSLVLERQANNKSKETKKNCVIKDQFSKVSTLDETDVKNKEELQKREKELNNKKKSINEKNEQISKNAKEIEDKKKLIDSKTLELSQMESNIKEKEKNIENKNKELNLKELNLKEKEKNIENKINELNQKELDFKNKEKNIENKNKELIQKELDIKNKEKNNENKNKELIQKELDIKNKEKIIENKYLDLNQKEKDIKNKQKIIDNKFLEINQKEKNIKNKEKILESKNLELNQKELDIKNKEKNLAQQMIEFENNKNKIFEDIRNQQNMPILVGLNNIGATCYMNSTLQCLSNTNKLTEYFLTKYKQNTNRIMSNVYYKLLLNLWDINKNNKSYSPNEFKEVLSKENPLFAGIAANDSKDLINFLIERFHQELNEVKIKIGNTNDNINIQDQTNEQLMLNSFIKEFGEKYNSPISNLFYGMMETKSQCQGCQIIKYNFQVYSFLEFPLQQVNQYCYNIGKRLLFNNDGTNPDVNLYECFDYYQKIDLMNGENQMYCNFCNKLCDSFYSTTIYSGPLILIINLNRGRGAVYECKVNFPEQLILFNYVMYKDGSTAYQLYAVICHIGPSSMSGHFVAYCRNRIDNKWYLYNDGMVSLCTKQKQYQDGMPYILFYKALGD